MKDKNKKRLLLCFCCAMAISALPLGFTSCKKDKKPTSSVEVDYGEEGVYYTNVDGKECLLTLIDDSNSFTLVIGSEVVVGTYSYNGKDFKLKFAGAKESTLAVYENNTLSFVYNEKTYDFVLKTDYTVTLDVDGEKTTKTVINGQLLDEPEAPQKEGYNFIGWYLDSDYKTQFSFASMPVTSNLTLYARFVEKVAGAQEYTVTYIVDGEEYGTAQTVSGSIFALPTPQKADKEFVGWWTSAYQDAEKLTSQYKAGDVLTQNTNLYAVWKSNALNVSVFADRVTWNEKSATSSYNVKIYNEAGAVINGNKDGVMWSEEEYSFDFVAYGAGEYKIEITVDGVTTTVYYRSKALARVSAFEVTDGVLTFAGVPNAEKYLITVDCGDDEHTHTEVDLGTNTFYNFADCVMQKGGIKFTVKAVAEGYVSSVSDVFAYEKNLDAVKNLAYNEEEAQVGWDKVANATGYVVEITSGGKTHTEEIGSATTYSVKEYSGEITFKVYPIARGYNSPDAKTLTFTKTTLSAPTGLAIESKKLTWNEVAGAESYVVLIGDKEIPVDTNELTLTEEHYDSSWDKAKVYVKAIGADQKTSVYSDALSVRISSMSELKYANGKVTWESVISAKNYYVQVGTQGIVKLAGTETSYSPTFDVGGLNTIAVYCSDGTTDSDIVTIGVTVHRISFDADGGERVVSLYKATGDAISLAGSVSKKDGYDFAGWYTAPGGASGTGVQYTDSVYQDTGDRVLYAAWSAKKFTLNLNVQGGVAMSNDKVEVTYKGDFTIPVPTHTDSSYIFAGWYNQNSSGVIGSVQYTDKDGKSIAPWSSISGETISAKWLHVVTLTKIDGKDAYKVKAGRDIQNVSSLVIPATQKGLPVIGIEANAFEGCTNLLEISIPDTIQSIDLGQEGGHGAGSAFIGCNNLKSLKVYCPDESKHDNVHEPDQIYFAENNSLMRLTEGRVELAFVPSTLTGKYTIPSMVEYIPIGAFRGTNVTEIVIPATVSYIADTAFDASVVEKVTFEESADGNDVELKMGTFVFRNCKKLTEITLPKRLTNFDNGWFSGCSQLAKVNVTEGSIYYSINGAVCKDSTLLYVPMRFAERTYTIPEGITTVGKQAFAYNVTINRLIIPFYVTEIGESAFEMAITGYAKPLKTLEFQRDDQSALLTIRKRAFYNCENLTEVKLPIRTGTVEQYAFGNCLNLKKVILNGDQDMKLANGAFSNDKSNFYVTHVELGVNVANVNIAGVFGNQVLESVKVHVNNNNYESGSEATGDEGVLYNKGKEQIMFYPNARVGDFVIPDTVTKIGAQVFQGTKLTSIEIGEQITEIGDNAFYNCQSLTTITFAPSTDDEPLALTIGQRAFGQTGISSITLPDRVTTIGKNAFQSCTKLSSVHFGANAQLADMTVLASCSKLATITVSDENKSYQIIDGVLYQTTKVEVDENTTEYVPYKLLLCPTLNTGNNGTVIIPNTVMEISSNSFSGTQSIKNVSFSGDYEDGDEPGFGSSVFYNSGLQTITLPRGITEIPYEMFNSCRYLTYVFVPNTVTYIDNKAFSICPALTEIEFEEDGEDELYIEDGGYTNGTYYGSFYYTGLTELTLPARTGYIGDYAFANNNTLSSINIPADVSYLGTAAFINCLKLETVVFESVDGVASLTELSEELFANLTSLKNVTLAEGIEYIGAKAFFNCTSLVGINIPNSVEAIGESAFESASSLQYILIDAENSVLDTIEKKAFYNARALNRSTLEAGETPTITLPATITTIEENAFNKCINLGAITFATSQDGSALTTIGDRAFAYSGIKSFVFPNNKVDGASIIETKCGYMIFGGCANLKSVSLSNAIFTVGDLFKGCYSIETLSVDEDNEYFLLHVDQETGATFLMDKSGSQYSYVLGTLTGKLNIKDGVQSINSYAFANITGITELTIPASVKVIGDNAFKGCTSLEKVTFADGSALTSLGVGAFENCVSLKTINLEKATALNTLGEKTFAKCAKLANITLPNSLTGIGTNVFQNSGLTAIVIPESIRTIPAYAFDGAKSLASVSLHQYVTNIGDSAFAGTGLDGEDVVNILTSCASNVTYGTGLFGHCENLVSISIPTSMTTIPRGMFANCTKLANISFPASVTSIGESAFSGCTALTNVTLPNSLNSIGDSAFKGCQFTSITLPDSLGEGTTTTPIGASAFENCTALTSITIPKNVLTLGNRVFANCTALKTVKFHDNFTGFTCSSTTVNNTKNATFFGCSSLGDIQLGDNVTSIGCAFATSGITSIALFANKLASIPTYAFYNCARLTTVTFDGAKSSTITSIGNSAFLNCTALKNIVLPINDSATTFTLGSSTFSGCTSLSTLDTSKVTAVGSSCFKGSGITQLDLRKVSSITTSHSSLTENCASLTKLQLNDSVTTIPSSMLKGCASLVEFTLPASLTSIKGSKVLEGCGIKNLVVPAGVTLNSLDNSAFENSTGLETIEFKYATTSKNFNFKYYTFRNSKNLKSVKFDASLPMTQLNDTFHGCSSLESFTIPETVTTITNKTFYGCSSLKSMVLPEKVKSVNGTVSNGVTYGIFADCTSLETVKIPSTWTSIPSYMFYNCTSLKSVDMPTEKITSIATYAFYNTTSMTSFTIPQNVTSIASMAFMYSGVPVFTVPAKVSSISSGAFGGDALKQIIVDTASTRFVADENGALWNASKSVLYAYPIANYVDEDGTLTIPEAVADAMSKGKSISGGSMVSERIKSVVLLDGLTTVNSNMFANMPNLESVYIPDSVTAIYSKAFYNCPSLKTVRMSANLEEISDNAFEGCTSLTTLTNAENMNSLYYIGEKAFYNCASLTNMHFANEVLEEIGANAFNGCKALVIDVDFSDATEMYTFGGEERSPFNNSGITSLVLPQCVTIIGRYEEQNESVPYYAGDAYDGGDWYAKGMDNLTSITLTAVEAVGSAAFYKCKSLREVIYTDALHSIGDFAFQGSGLTSFTVKPTVTMLGVYVFEGCTSLETVVFEEGVKDVKTYSWCNPVYDIEWPWEDRGGYGMHIFGNCTALKTVIIPDTMELIEKYTFAGCTAIENLYIPSTVVLGQGAFSGVANTVYVAATDAEAEELWMASWKEGITGEIVYGYKKASNEPESGTNTDGE